jgi:2-haloacid dehalogenase
MNATELPVRRRKRLWRLRHECHATGAVAAAPVFDQRRTMSIDRRKLLAAATSLLAAPIKSTRAQTQRRRLRAVAFDGLAIFHARRTLALAEAAFPGRGLELVDVWQARQMDYQWIRVAGSKYADFMQVTSDSLEFAARALRLELPADVRASLVGVYLALDAWRHARIALRSLKDSGLRLALLSNMTQPMLTGGIDHAGLRGLFDFVLSTNEVMSFKPARHAYELGTRALGLPRDSILFVASAGWDVAGAKWYGYPTYWVNRSGVPEEVFDVAADGVGRDFSDLLAFIAREDNLRGDGP